MEAAIQLPLQSRQTSAGRTVVYFIRASEISSAGIRVKRDLGPRPFCQRPRILVQLTELASSSLSNAEPNF
jgi:hypothetical protein